MELRVFRPRGKSRRVGGCAWTLFAWCKDQDLDDPLAAAFFLGQRLFRWSDVMTAQEFGRSRATVRRGIRTGRAEVLEALEDERIKGHDLRELAERLSALGLAG